MSGQPASDSPSLRRRALAAVARLPSGLWLEGQWREPASGLDFAVDDPASGQIIARVARAGAPDVEAAVRAAQSALLDGPWATLSGAERGECLHRLHELLLADFDTLALIEALDGGNPLESVRAADLPMALAALRDHAGWANKISGDVPLSSAQPSAFAYASREPVGIVAVITPWNAPFLMALKKVSAALAAGCVVILKPAELAPLSAIRLTHWIEQAGFPAGVFQLLPGLGREAGQALIDHPAINMVSFTGSTAIGREIVAASARSNLKRFVLELGGKSPVFVFADADLDKAAKAVADEIVFKSGQYCGAGTRLYLQAAIQRDFLSLLASHLASVPIGPGLVAGHRLGPLISRAQRERVRALVAEGIAQGAEPLLPEAAVPTDGYFHGPVLLQATAPGMRVFDEEVFGPVLCATTFDDNESLPALVDSANQNPYGLAAKIWTRDLARIHRLVRRVQAGTVIVNDGGGEKALPFGGFKQSGMGRENAQEGIHAFTEWKTVRLGW